MVEEHAVPWEHGGSTVQVLQQNVSPRHKEGVAFDALLLCEIVHDHSHVLPAVGQLPEVRQLLLERQKRRKVDDTKVVVKQNDDLPNMQKSLRRCFRNGRFQNVWQMRICSNFGWAKSTRGQLQFFRFSDRIDPHDLIYRLRHTLILRKKCLRQNFNVKIFTLKN